MNSKYIFLHVQIFLTITPRLIKKRVLALDVFSSGQSVSKQMLDNNIPEDILYLVRNYWTQFDHDNSMYSPVTVQHAVVEHLYLLSWIPEKRAYSYLTEALTKVGSNCSVFRLFFNTYGQRLCDPVSPVCNQNLFIQAAARLLNHTEMPEDNKNIVRHWLELIRNTDSESSINNMYNIG